MKLPYNTSLLLLVLSVLSACDNTAVKDDAVSNNSNPVSQSETINAAKQSFTEVDNLGYAWRDTEETIIEAEKALQDGDTAKAEELAKEAINQNKLAKEQHAREINAGPLN